MLMLVLYCLCEERRKEEGEKNMDLIRWEPLKDALGWQDRFNRVFQNWARDFPVAADLAGGRWMPPVDIYESDGEVVLKAELPEVDRKDIKLSIESNTLTLEGERQFENETKKENYHRVERAYGSFCRSFTLPATIDQEKVKADYKDGVLKIVLPKKPEHKPKQISVSIN